MKYRHPREAYSRVSQTKLVRKEGDTKRVTRDIALPAYCYSTKPANVKRSKGANITRKMTAAEHERWASAQIRGMR